MLFVESSALKHNLSHTIDQVLAFVGVEDFAGTRLPEHQVELPERMDDLYVYAMFVDEF